MLDQQIHTNDATGRLLFDMLGAIAQFETERQMDGNTLAKARGVVFGRSKRLTRPQIAALPARREQSVLIRTLMYDERISKATVYRYLHEDGAAAGA